MATPHGMASWKGNLDLSTLEHPLGRTFRMDHCEIEVYQEGCGTPPMGKELNRPCRVTFKTDRAINQERIRQQCLQNHSCLLRKDQKSGTFTVLVPHFTKYNFNL
jgi:hypothetical protein